MAADSANAPAKSMLRRVGTRAMCSFFCTSSIDSRPMGRLMKNTHRQLRWSTKKPPASGPSNVANANDAAM